MNVQFIVTIALQIYECSIYQLISIIYDAYYARTLFNQIADYEKQFNEA